MVSDDLTRLKAALDAAGVAGTDDFGRFVNNPTYFAPSTFEEQAAMPVLLALLPTLEDPKVVDPTARHLNRRWARPDAFVPLLAAFHRWAAADPLGVGWTLGDSLANAATVENLDTLLALSMNRQYGRAREMIIYSLWRYRKQPQVAPALIDLIADPDVALHAMTALRRTVGSQAALPHLEHLAVTGPHEQVRRQAAKQAKKARS